MWTTTNVYMLIVSLMIVFGGYSNHPMCMIIGAQYISIEFTSDYKARSDFICDLFLGLHTIYIDIINTIHCFVEDDVVLKF